MHPEIGWYLVAILAIIILKVLVKAIFQNGGLISAILSLALSFAFFYFGSPTLGWMCLIYSLMVVVGSFFLKIDASDNYTRQAEERRKKAAQTASVKRFICKSCGETNAYWYHACPSCGAVGKMEKIPIMTADQPQAAAPDPGTPAPVSPPTSTQVRADRPQAAAPSSCMVAMAFSDGTWVCSCGRHNAKYVSSCACGRSKREVLAASRLPGCQTGPSSGNAANQREEKTAAAPFFWAPAQVSPPARARVGEGQSQAAAPSCSASPLCAPAPVSPPAGAQAREEQLRSTAPCSPNLCAPAQIFPSTGAQVRETKPVPRPVARPEAPVKQENCFQDGKVNRRVYSFGVVPFPDKPGFVRCPVCRTVQPVGGGECQQCRIRFSTFQSGSSAQKETGSPAKPSIVPLEKEIRYALQFSSDSGMISYLRYRHRPLSPEDQEDLSAMLAGPEESLRQRLTRYLNS